MSSFFVTMLERLDNNQSHLFLTSLERIQTADQTPRLLYQESHRLFHDYRLTQDYRSAMKILKTTIGSNQHNEYMRLLLLNQFRAVYQQQSQLFIEGQTIQKAIAAFYLFGQDQQSIAEYGECYHYEIQFLRNLTQLDKENSQESDMTYRQMEKVFQQQLKANRNYKTIYVDKFRIQTYHFWLSDYSGLNNILIEMSLPQMCRILLLPTDYFNDYYDAFNYTITKLFSQTEQINQTYEQYIVEIKFTNIFIKIHDKQLFMNAVHTGITRAIVNYKISLNQNSEIKTGILDAYLIMRRLLKYSQLDQIDDIIYETLIYKLK